MTVSPPKAGLTFAKSVVARGTERKGSSASSKPKRQGRPARLRTRLKVRCAAAYSMTHIVSASRLLNLIRIDYFVVNPNRVIDGLGTKRLNAETFKRLQQGPDNFIPATGPALLEAAPECPAPVQEHVDGPYRRTTGWDRGIGRRRIQLLDGAPHGLRQRNQS